MKAPARLRRLIRRRATPLQLPTHIRVRTRPGRALIQENSWKLRRGALTVLATVTVVGWALWIILFGAMLSAIAWTLGVWYFTSQWDELQGFNGLAAFIEEDWPTGIAFCGVFLAWAMLRTWARSRREPGAPNRACAKAAMSAMDFGPVAAASCLVCQHDTQGRLLSVEEVQRPGEAVIERPPLLARSASADAQVSRSNADDQTVELG
jgi:poly-beta-1,6-N-acetyl-D-glucosamine biosynthesis protein PgaD